MQPEEPCVVPDDFPQEFLGSVSGAQPKLLLERADDGSYVDSTVARRRDRWLICVDLREQLIDYVYKHLPASTSASACVESVIHAVERKRAGWGLSIAEADWLGKQLRAHFGQ